jgi:hypothetical protein
MLVATDAAASNWTLINTASRNYPPSSQNLYLTVQVVPVVLVNSGTSIVIVTKKSVVRFFY